MISMGLEKQIIYLSIISLTIFTLLSALLFYKFELTLGSFLISKYVKTIYEYIICTYFVFSNLKLNFSFNNKFYLVIWKFKKVAFKYSQYIISVYGEAISTEFLN